MSEPAVEHSRRCAIQRRLAAWAGHAPALRLLYREPLQRELHRANWVAAAATIAGIALAIALAPPQTRWAWVLLTWLVGHVAWGTYLACKLRPAIRSNKLGPPRRAIAKLARCPACIGSGKP